MASLYKKVISGKPYWYLREMGWVDGKPKMVSERYVGSAADIEALLEAREAQVMPERTRHLGFGGVAAAWQMMKKLGVVETIDEIVGPRRADAAASTGTYLTLAALNRLVAPCSKLAFADWWKSTAADRFTKIAVWALDHRMFWQAMHDVGLEQLQRIEQKLAARMVEQFGLDISGLALDMTNFATYIDSANDRAPIAQRGKAKQKRTDLRIVALGLVVTRDGGIPLASLAYPGNRNDVSQFTAVLDALMDRHATISAYCGAPDPAELTVVFDAGQNSAPNFAHLAKAKLGYVGSVPPSMCADLLARPAGDRTLVDEQTYPGVTALEVRRAVYGAKRRTLLVHSPTLHTAQARGFDQTMAKAEANLTGLADRLAGGKTRRGRPAVEAEIEKICHDPWLRRVITWDLTGEQPKDFRLTWTLDTTARDALEEEVFGKRILITGRDHWPAADVIAAYRSQSDAEFAFRQMKDPHQVSFSPMHHWTDHNIRVHTFTCVLALQIAHLMRRQAAQHGLAMSVAELIDTLAGIEETVLIYPSTGGRPKARRILTDTTPTQNRLIDIFDLHPLTPPVRS